VGDRVLKGVAQRCRKVMRQNDVFGRVGGEEFALLLPETDALDAMRAAERFRCAIESPAMNVTPPLLITASFGVAALCSGVSTAEEWLAYADAPLYAAKHGGRNRCCNALAPFPITQLA
jgi:diguanylate cyclase (GGDEF)-like protein